MSLHCDAEEGNEVHDQDGPEDGDVEELPEGTEECNRRGLGGGVPELELGQPPDEGPELLVLVGGKHVRTIYKETESISISTIIFTIPSSASNSAIAGSILGVRKASSRLRW